MDPLTQPLADSSLGQRTEHISQLVSPWSLNDCIPVAPTLMACHFLLASSPPQGMTRDAGPNRQLANHSDVITAGCAITVSQRCHPAALVSYEYTYGA